jgi:hypothetical protein
MTRHNESMIAKFAVGRSLLLSQPSQLDSRPSMTRRTLRYQHRERYQSTPNLGYKPYFLWIEVSLPSAVGTGPL